MVCDVTCCGYEKCIKKHQERSSISTTEDIVPLTTDQVEDVCKVTVRNTETGREVPEADHGQIKKRIAVGSAFLGVIWMIYSLVCVIKDWLKNRADTLTHLTTLKLEIRKQWLPAGECHQDDLHNSQNGIKERRAVGSTFKGVMRMVYSLVCVIKDWLKNRADSLPCLCTVDFLEVDNRHIKKRIAVGNALIKLWGVIWIYSSVCVLKCWLKNRVNTLACLTTKSLDLSYKAFYCQRMSRKLRWGSFYPSCQTKARLDTVVLRKQELIAGKHDVLRYSESEIPEKQRRDPDVCEVVKWTYSGLKQHRDPDMCEVVKWIMIG